MTTITSTATLTIGDAATVTESTSLLILPVAGASEGTGRLVHPTFGAYDYERPPDSWTNMLGDALISPVWASTKTLDGAQNTVFAGALRDVVIEEAWNQSVCCSIDHLQALLAIWMNPPDPSVAYVEWYPSYISSLGFKVVILGLTVGGKEITQTPLVHQGWVRGPLVLRMRIAGRV